jgi:menaquinone-dependent protoporphyrinogen IX oxidase
VAAAILLVGCIGLAMVGAATQAGSARQYQSRLAQDVAEAGVTVTLDKLNSTYPLSACS